MKRFKGKAAIITGASSGIGRASAQRLASEGAKVMLGDINKPGLEETAKAIVEAGGNASMYVFDGYRLKHLVHVIVFKVP